MPALIAEGADIRRQSRSISNVEPPAGYGEPGDNAFHLRLAHLFVNTFDFEK